MTLNQSIAYRSEIFELDLYKQLNNMELITPQITIGLLLISIGVVSKFDTKFDIKFDFLKDKE